MEIDINQYKVSCRDRYKIFIEGQLTYSASTEIFEFLSPIILIYEKGQGPSITINKQLSWFTPKYDFVLSNRTIIEFRTKSVWFNHYQCRRGNDLFEIYGHKENLFSVYKNGVQVAYWDKDPFSQFEGDNYKIIADGNSDFQLIICFCLTMDNYSTKSNDGSTATYDFGNFGREARAFNEEWMPKEMQVSTQLVL